tara:strand:+ start:500 stop:2194 length:1695 start_codon:yes stop_codon:yes gene_type:complete
MAAKPLQPLVLDSIGIYGLNRQSSAASLPPQYLTTANNIMLDEKGRLTTRQGIQQITNLVSSSATSNTLIVKSLGEYQSATGAKTIFAGAGANIYKMNTATTPYTLTAQSFSGGTTKSDGNWQFTNFNNNFYGAQQGNKPVNFNGTTWLDLEDVSGYAKPSSVTTFTPSCLLGDFGRLWAADVGENRNVVYYSDLLIGHKFQGGGAGFLDLRNVWSGDVITAMASFMGKLVIFGKNNIVIFRGPWDVNVTQDGGVFSLDEVIEGVGCVARDSVQLIGDDIVFLSASGVRSLGRTIQQDTMPLTDLSLAVKDEIRTNILTSNLSSVKAQYDLSTGSYILGFPDRNIVYVFDFKSSTPDGAPRITTWNFESKKNPKSFLSTDEFLYCGLGAGTYAGRVATYSGYFDIEKTILANVNQATCVNAGNTWDSTGSGTCWVDSDITYQADFKTTWLDFEQPGISKFLKRFLAIWSGGKNMDITLNWYRDYNVAPSSANFSLDPATGGVTSLWGAGKYAAAKYAPAFQPAEYKVSLSKAAKVVRFEVIQTVKGFKASLQNMTILAKQGKIR